jgi:hypothetical protein
VSYDQAFYNSIRPGCQAAAAQVIPWLMDLFNPQSIIDIGCGEGHFLAEAKRCGAAEVYGVDGHEWADRRMEIAVGEYRRHNFESSRYIAGKMRELAICLEVAEHLSAAAAERLVADLCNMAPMVLFSAAIPGQGGEGHQTEKWQSWWAERFYQRKFWAHPFIQSKFWDVAAIPPWYRQNWMLYIREDITADITLPPQFERQFVADRVHPDIFRAKDRHIAMLVLTDGRRQCMERTMASFASVRARCNSHVMVDDSQSPEYAAWLDAAFPEFTIFHSQGRLGFAGAIQKGWALIPPHAEYIVHCEDDFLLNQPWDLNETFNLLESHPDLAQVCLRRQPWGAEPADGGFIAQWPDLYKDESWGGVDYLTHRAFFSTNPSMYPIRIARMGWPEAPGSEGKFGPRLWDQGYRCAFLGKRSDGPRVTHIGIERTGSGY